MRARSVMLMLALLSSSGACSEPPARADGESTPKAAPAPAAPAHAPPSSSAAVQPSAQLGQPAPDFTLSDTEGKTVRLADLRGKTVVLEWFNPECPFVKSAHGKGALRTMAKERASDKLVWLSINSGAPGKQGHGAARNQAGKAEFGMVNTVLLDESGTVGRAYGAQKTPHMFVIDAKGTLVYRGGLDNAPMGVVDDARPRAKDVPPGTLVSYVADALDALAAGKPVPLADTPAYGCSVKYGG